MHCPKCDYEGYVQSGICPNCGEKLLPTAKLFKSTVKPKSFIGKIADFIAECLYRLFEGAILYVGFYAAAFGLIYFYNLLCDEIVEWNKIAFNGVRMYYVKIGVGVAILIFEFKWRWRHR